MNAPKGGGLQMDRDERETQLLMRDVRPEDIEASIYSALGINWTTIRSDDPLGRGFEYVPFANYDIYGPVNELWA